MTDIYQELWDNDEDGLTVSASDGAGGWVNPDADILLDEQAQAGGKRHIDLATRPLFARVNEDKLSLPTYQAFIRLLDNYVCNSHEPEEETEEEREEIHRFLDAVTNTTVAELALDYINGTLGENLSMTGLRAVLDRIWFTQYTNHYAGRATRFASGFEHVFVGEGSYSTRFGSQEHRGEVRGYHSWLKFYLDERGNRVNFHGYKYDLQGNQGADNPRVVTLQMTWSLTDIRGNPLATLFKKKGGFFVGTSPECELMMGAVAFYESVHGRLVKDRRHTTIHGADYNLVMYRSTTPQGTRGEFIRSFYPELLPGRARLNAGAGRSGERRGDDRALPAEPPMDRTITISVPANAVQQHGPIVISAALPNPVGQQAEREWVELCNISDTDIELTGWEMRDRGGRPEALAGTLAAGEKRRFYLARAHAQSMQLGNRTGDIALYRGTELIAMVSYRRAGAGEVFMFYVSPDEESPPAQS